MSGFLARRVALAGAKSLRGAFGKLIKKGAPKAQRAGSRANKGKPLKKSGATTIKGINIKTKAGKEFGEKIKNQPKRIRGQKPEGMRDDLPADIDVPSFLKKNPRKKQAGGALVSLRRRGLDKGRRDMKNTFKEAKRNKPEGRMNLDDVKAVQARNKARLGKASTKALKARGMKQGGGLREIPEGNKGLPKLPKEVRNKMGFMKDGGAPKPGSKVSVKQIDEMMQGFKKGDKLMQLFDPIKRKKLRDKALKKKDGGLVSATAKLKAQGLKDGGPVRGKARGMGAATKGGGYNV